MTRFKPDGRIPRFHGNARRRKGRRDLRRRGRKDTSPAYLQYLKNLRISIGTRIKVVERIEYDRSLVIETRKSIRISVSKQFAESVIVD